MSFEGRQKLYLGTLKIARNQRTLVLHMANLCSLVRRTRWSIVSTAFLKSMKTTPVRTPLSIFLLISSTKKVTVVSAKELEILPPGNQIDRRARDC